MPWISRRDLDRLYALLDKLTDHKVRSERVEAGLHETPAAPRKLLPMMPEEVRRWVESHEGKSIQQRLRKEVTAAAKEAGSWEPIVQRIQQEASE